MISSISFISFMSFIAFMPATCAAHAVLVSALAWFRSWGVVIPGVMIPGVMIPRATIPEATRNYATAETLKLKLKLYMKAL